ncbi:MAG: substrate-binding domain-containing protein [Lachnospiraceae bacterium]|nr:substrate-binding domain-containing protein [Lachnospiraceae bacterium]
MCFRTICKRFIVVFAVVLSMFLFSCDNKKAEYDTIENIVSKNQEIYEKMANYPIVDGSTANIPMMAQIMSDYLGIPLEEARNNYQTVLTTDKAWENMKYKYHNFDDNYPELLLVYEPSEKLKNRIKEPNNELIINPIGVDALVFIKNKSNPIDNLSTEDLVNIYAGETTNWKTLGGEDKPIEAFQRIYNSGSQTLFTKLLMKDKKPMEAKEGYYLAEMGDVITRLSEYKNDANAIGYSVFYYAKKMYANPDLTFFSIDGISPTDKTIENGTYPFLNQYYVVIRADEPEDSEVRKLYNYILSDKGKESIRKAGYIPTNNNDRVVFE